MGDAAWHPIATGILVRQMPKQRGQALGVHAAGGTLAEVLSAPAGRFSAGFPGLARGASDFSDTRRLNGNCLFVYCAPDSESTCQ